MTYFVQEMLNTDFNIVTNDILSPINICIKVKNKIQTGFKPYILVK